MFQKATKKQARLRMAIAGPSGSGKTYSALRIGTSMAERVALIDTEHGSAAKYADVFDFHTLQLGPPYAPERFIECIEAAEGEGFDLVIIDSFSHAWKGEGGVLEIVDDVKKRQKGGGSFSAWSEATPRHRALIDAILSSTVHVIATMRSKQKYVMEDDEQGGQRVQKRGMSPVQRDNVEYEFDVFADMDMDHNLIVSKSRFDQLQDAVIEKPGEAVAAKLQAWLSDGEPTDREKAIHELEQALEDIGASPEREERAKNWASTQKDPESILNAAESVREDEQEKTDSGKPTGSDPQPQKKGPTSQPKTSNGSSSTTSDRGSSDSNGTWDRDQVGSDAADAMQNGETALPDVDDDDLEEDQEAKEDGSPEMTSFDEKKAHARSQLADCAEVSFADVEEQATVYLSQVADQPQEWQIAIRKLVEQFGVEPLPHDFPFAEKLRAAGIYTLPRAERQAETGDLMTIDGLGESRVQKIRDALEGLDFRSLPDPAFEEGFGDEELPFD